jgi:predicted  nucleic acid-binding Zn-ribbon protein
MDTLKRPTNGADAASVKSLENGDDTYRPDLSKEVAMLSTKLINAINHQTNLDDSLQATRHELDWARQEVKRVRAEKQSLDDAIAQGVLVKKAEMDRTIAELRAQLAIEKMHRENAEKSKKATEGELENLTSSLFEEANKMVEAAKKETKAVEKRNSQLKAQMNDQEAMLKTQQNQLQDMRLTLERTETNARESGSTPGTPITSAATTGTNFDVPRTPNDASPSTNIPPDHPLHFSELISPVLRTDVSSYTDFAELLAWARRGAPHSRTASGNMASASTTNLSSSSIAIAATTSSPNLPGAFSFGSSSANSSPNSANFNGAYSFTPPLKESKFYKRALIEDIEPTLRLDLAPGLSFLSRRTVNSALLNGTLSIEPFTPPTKFYSPIFACSLCGEARKAEPYIRRHRFRTSESEDASKYPLCEFCLGRVRSAADFVSFLRMVKDGHWRCEGEEEEKKAWEESVRLRERMFWARLGGGVVPATVLERQRESKEVEWEAEKVADVPSAEEQRGPDTVPEQAEPAEPPPQADVDASDDGDGGIGRAIVNMSSQAASSAMPELRPAESSAFHTPETEMPPPITPEHDSADSDREQAAASAQLQSEAETSRPASPPKVTEESLPTADDGVKGSDAETEEETQAPALPQRTSSELSSERPSTASSQRTLSPSKAAGGDVGSGKEERRPSSASSVLARVRAMEARGGK